MNETMKTIIDAILPNISEIIITIISLIVARYILPYIKNDMIPWFKEKRLHGIIKNFVQAVEKMAESGIIEKCDKKTKVIELLEKKGIIVDDITEAFIEGCVKELDIITSTIYDGIVIDTEGEIEVDPEIDEEPEVIIETEDV